jgi:hypothetical protein
MNKVANKIARIKEKFAAVIIEQQYREAEIVIRKPIGTTFHVDYANGTDGSGTVHDGIMEDNSGANYTTETGTTTTAVYVSTSTLDNNTDDNYNGDYLYNVTRSIGVIITDYDADDLGGYSVLTHPTITGQIVGDEFYIIRASKTLLFALETTTLAPGDVVKLRANTTWSQSTEGVDVNIDDDGDGDNLIEIKSCDSTDDPWDDDSDVRAIVDFQDAAYQLTMSSDYYSKWSRIDFMQSTDSMGQIYIGSTIGFIFENCRIYDRGTNDEGIYLANAMGLFDGCEFWDNGTISVRAVSGTMAQFKDCIFNGGSGISTDYGIQATQSILWVEDCSFGQTTAHDTDDIYASVRSQIFVRNCAMSGAYVTVVTQANIYFEDYDEAFQAHKMISDIGDINRATGVGRSGGSSTVADITPNANIGVNNPMHVRGRNNKVVGDFQVYCEANMEHTVSVWMRAAATWSGSYPTAAQMYVTAHYLSNAGTCERSWSPQSTQVISGTTWVEFTTKFTPARSGYAYVWFYLTVAGVTIDTVRVDLKVE